MTLALDSRSVVRAGGIAAIALAMNGWGEAEPAWWLNLQASPRAAVAMKGGATRSVRARAAHGEEWDRLWALVASHNGWGHDLDAFARLRSRQTAVVVFEPVA